MSVEEELQAELRKLEQLIEEKSAERDRIAEKVEEWREFPPPTEVHLEDITDLYEEEYQKLENLNWILSFLEFKRDAFKEELEDLTKQTRAIPLDRARRRALVRAVYRHQPQSKGKDLNLQTCRELDASRIGVLEAWERSFGVTSWVQGYRHDEVKPLIESMFSKYRNEPF